MKKNIVAMLFSFVVLAAFVLVLAIPESRTVFKSLSSEHPFLMGFVKFGLLATVGEVLALRIRKKEWDLPVRVWQKALIWGAIGVAITFMMSSYKGAVSVITENGLIPGKNSVFLKALYTSAIMNLSFGPTFMAFHKCTDKWLDLGAEKKDNSLKSVIEAIDWHGFVSFTLFKTIPLFWIPAHTVTFLLPGEYQVIVAASLSIALGIILSIKK